MGWCWSKAVLPASNGSVLWQSCKMVVCIHEWCSNYTAHVHGQSLCEEEPGVSRGRDNNEPLTEEQGTQQTFSKIILLWTSTVEKKHTKSTREVTWLPTHNPTSLAGADALAKQNWLTKNSDPLWGTWDTLGMGLLYFLFLLTLVISSAQKDTVWTGQSKQNSFLVSI